MKKALTLTLLLATLTLLLAPAVTQAATPTSTEKQVIRLVNKERTKRGLAPVRFNTKLTVAARAHSREMARRQTLTHRSANGDSVATRLISYSYTRSSCRYWAVGENIACARTSSLLSTPQGVVYQWMHSSAHRAVILKSTFRDVGVGIATSSNGVRYFTLDMGRRIR
ncbi:MAG: CAP domain-containing protein [Thermoleophilia bacterium]